MSFQFRLDLLCYRLPLLTMAFCNKLSTYLTNNSQLISTSLPFLTQIPFSYCSYRPQLKYKTSFPTRLIPLLFSLCLSKQHFQNIPPRVPTQQSSTDSEGVSYQVSSFSRRVGLDFDRVSFVGLWRSVETPHSKLLKIHPVLSAGSS